MGPHGAILSHLLWKIFWPSGALNVLIRDNSSTLHYYYTLYINFNISKDRQRLIITLESRYLSFYVYKVLILFSLQSVMRRW